MKIALGPYTDFRKVYTFWFLIAPNDWATYRCERSEQLDVALVMLLFLCILWLFFQFRQQ